MKKILLALALVSGAAQAATLNPIQLLNPAGSSSGQTIVSTGASTAPAWAAVPATGLSGIVPVANGGTNRATLTAHGVVVGEGTASVGLIGPCNNGQMLLGVTGADPYCGNNPAISGGTVDGTPVGATTSSTGAFTTLAAAGNDNLVYTTTNALSLANASVVTVTTFTKQYDKVNTNFNASTGVFTAPQTGFYQVCGNFVLASAANVVSARLLAAVQVNGSTVTGAGATAYQSSTNTLPTSLNFCSDINVTQAQTVTVVLTQNTGATRALDGTTSNWISIKRIP